MSEYQKFLATKAQSGSMDGFHPTYIPDFLFPFQKALVEWAVLKGKSAIFADCGLGKTPMQLVWAENVLRHTNKAVLIITPLAVSAQTIREGQKFAIEVYRSLNGQGAKTIIVTNYEKLHKFEPSKFAGVVCDESSILKSFDGVRRTQITEFMRQVPYRLLCTATAAPNDYIELGTSSEALGELGYIDMLTCFFVNDQHSISTHRLRGTEPGWRFKGHAQKAFWRWVCSWARAIRRPSDLGCNDDGFILPPLHEMVTVVTARTPHPDMLFDLPAIGLKEERQVRRRTIEERSECVANKVANTGKPAVVWCHLNDEGDALNDMIKDSIQISGADADESKEEKFEAFLNGQVRVLVIKPKIGAFGLNWQHCAHVVYFASHSYEQYYQAIRRCWRFGQTHPVTVDLIRTDAEEYVVANLRRKERQAVAMFTDLVRYMNEAQNVRNIRKFTKETEIPKWL